jgi:acyl-coenzyme A synthetase/AMP-(fatty) acid ligase
MIGTAPRLEHLFTLMAERHTARAIAEGDLSHSYGDLLAEIGSLERCLDYLDIGTGQVIGLQSNFRFTAIALAFALFRRGCIVAFLSPNTTAETMLGDCHASGLFRFAESKEPSFARFAPRGTHPLIDRLRRERKPGFVIFSSGSSGKPKAILHDLDGFFAAYERPMKPMVTLAFLLFDHIAGLDTMFYTLHSGGTLVLVDERTPQAVCDAVSQWRVETLPVSPSFLKLLCLSDVTERADLSSLSIVTFGSEPMDAPTLSRVTKMLPNVALRQKYGASEFGAPSVKTRDGDGLWIQFHGDTARIEQGILWVRAPSTMVGYLNADPPAIRDGWVCTGDRIEMQGEWLRVLGRDSDLINVGGEKVFPSEVEAVISELDAVAEVAVSGEKHALMGQIVSAMVRPRSTETDVAALRSLVRSHCMQRLMRYKVPTKINFTSGALFNERQKLMRAHCKSHPQPGKSGFRNINWES